MQRLLKLAAVIFFIVSFWSLTKALFLNHYQDFQIYYLSSKTFLMGGNAYLPVKGILTSYLYPPFSIVFLSPFSRLPLIASERIWAFCSLLSLFIAIYLIFLLYKKNLFSTLGFVVLGLVCLSFPVKFTFGMGQINNFILLLFVLSAYFLNKNKNYSSAFFLSLSFAIKFFPIFLLPYFFLLKRWKFLAAFIISFIFLSLVTLIILKPQVNIYFYQKVFPSLTIGWKMDYYNQALTGFLSRSVLNLRLREMLDVVISLAFFITSYFVIWKTRNNKKLLNMHLGILVTLGLLINNFSWQHHFVFMIFPFLVTLFYVQKIKHNLKFIFIILISYFLISFNLANPNVVPILLRSHVFYGALLMWILQLFLIWKDSPKLRLHFPSAWKH